MFTFRTVLIGFVILASFMDHVLSQRSPYAGSRPVGYKDRYRPKPNDSSDGDITNRFGEENLDNQISTTQRPPSASVIVVYGVAEPFTPNNGSGNNVNFQDRFGGGSDIGVGMGGAGSSSPDNGNVGGGSRQTTERLPYDARGDEQLVNILNSRPVDQRPFWLVNYQQIEAQRNTSVGGNQQTVASRPSFQGKR